jgi:hypothetical protein
MKGYGELSEEQSSFLAGEAALLMELSNQALDDLDREPERR